MLTLPSGARMFMATGPVRKFGSPDIFVNQEARDMAA